MMTVIIFIPLCVYKEDDCHLYGFFHQSPQTNVTTFYVLHVQHNMDKDDKNSQLLHIGHYNKKDILCESNNYNRRNSKGWLLISNKCDDFVVKKIVIEEETINLPPQKFIFIVYDFNIFLNTELLLVNNEENGIRHENYFKTLVHSIKHCHTISSEFHNRVRRTKMINFIQYFVTFLNFILSGFVVLMPVLKFSSLCLRVHNSLESLTWALNSHISNKGLTLKTGNYILATLVDIVSGLLVLYCFMALASTTIPSQLLLNTAEDVVHTLQELLKWLMGIPAGLKLNFAFNNMLGKFFLYHINLWWTFLVLAEPLLDLMFYIFLCFGRLGLTFQAAILADLLALASFHIYCIYVYAARLYNLQISGLLALWRLFLGRKKNPLRGRVDSCEYSANQLFIGTLAFTILLFLLPTTFMYYIVFATLRLLVAALAGLLIRVQFLLQMLPLYTTAMWLFKSTLTNSSLHVQPQRRKPGLSLVLSMTPVRGSLWKSIQNSVPDPVKRPPTVLWGMLFKNIVTGQLIYPV